MPPIIGRSTEGRDVRINVERLIETRAIVLSNSGGGKSWALRRLLEQTYGMIQQIMIDVEGEFFTLREKFDYVLAGRPGGAEGDCPAEPRSAAMLARKLLELRTSAVIDIYELKPPERIKFVRLFLESMIDAPKNLWHPVLLVIDEAHIFAPEGAKCESTQSVVDMSSRGRKRGFCIVPATQRPSMLIKDVSAQCNNKLVGRFSQDIDVERAAKDLGFYKREDKMRFAALNQGEFFAVGPAFCDTVTQIKVGPVTTTHPRPGQRAMAPPPPREAVKKVLASLADLPAEAAKELVTVEELRAEVRRLQAEARKATPAADMLALKAQHAEVVRRYQTAAKRAVEMLANVPQAIEATREFIAPIAGEDAPIPVSTKAPSGALTSDSFNTKFTKPSATITARAESNGHKRESSGSLKGPEQRILDAIAWMESIGIDAPEQTAVAFLAGYTIGGGAFNNPRGSLRVKGLIEYAGDSLRLTDQGRALAKRPSAPLTVDALHANVMDRLPGPERKILDVLIKAYPCQLSSDDCARAAGYEPGGGAFNNPRGRLRTLGLIEYPQSGFVKATRLLFLEGR